MRTTTPLVLLAWLLPLGCVSTPESQRIAPRAVYIEGHFGYDAEADEAVGYSIDGEPFEPTLTVEIRDARYFETFDDRYACRIELVADVSAGGLPRAAWVDDANGSGEEPVVAFGFTVPEDAAIDSSCTSFDDPSWPEDPADAITSWQWGIGIGPLGEQMTEELTAAVDASYGEGVWDAQWEPVILGAGFHFNGAANVAAGGYLAHDYGFGAAVDQDFEIATDEQGIVFAIAATDVLDGTLPSGIYEVYAWNGIEAVLVEQ